MQNADLIYVIGRIYDAALDPDLWCEVIGQIAALTRRHQGCLETLDYRNGQSRIFGHAGYDVYAAVANPAFLVHDHWAPRVDPSFCGDFVLGHDVLPEAERRKTAFANELAPGVGMATYDVCGLIARRLPDTSIADAFGGLMIYSDEKEGHFSDRDMAIMAALQPHLLRALHIQGEIEFTRTTASLQDELLNTMRTACWLVDTRGRPQYANTKAERMEVRGEIRRSDGRLAMRDRAADRWLQKRLNGWRTQAALVGEKESFVYYRDADERPQFLTVMPVAPERLNPLMPGQPLRPCMLVAVSDQQPELDANVDTVSRAFELTPAEADVLARFARGANPQRIADHTNKRLATVRTQFNSVLSKTGMNSQAELLALVHNTV